MIAKHLYLSVLFTFFVFSGCLAQLQRHPLTEMGGLTQELNRKAARTHNTPLTLPFFDDFSTYAGIPAEELWINGGVYVNNQFGLRAPSKGVATFDGLRASGQPYNFDPNINQAPVDTLTSRPINLSTVSASNGVTLSFFWQAGGLAEVPDADDFLLLQFKIADGTWQTVDRVQTKPGELQNQQGFVQAIIPLTAPNLFHPNFQFRFLSFGRPAGMYDIWNIDYVYLNKDRGADRKELGPRGNLLDNPYQSSIRDLTLSQQPKSLLNKYTAMPWEQFNVNPAMATATTDSTVLNNLETLNFNEVSYEYAAYDVASGAALFNPIQVPSSNIAPLNAGERRGIGVNLTGRVIPAFNGPRILRSMFTINTPAAPAIPGVDLRRNDTISNTTVLGDYYAYDDGSAEYGAGVRQQQGRVAIRYVLNKPGILTDVKIYFTKLERSLAGQTFVLSVWKKLDNQPGSVLYQKPVAVNYTDTLNKFYNYKLDAPVSIADTFYVGWQQTSSDLLTVGFDVNTDSRSQTFYNITGSTWQPNTQQVGSMMVRPVFGSITTAVEPEVETPPGTAITPFRVFPNPTNGPVTWNIPQVTHVQVFDVLGKLITEMSNHPSQPDLLDVSHLPDGVYILHLQRRQGTLRYKLVVKK